jgi:wyosine [tRNA(Phe)-imidazoG37] synthetase (radical SAM superfamily)
MAIIARLMAEFGLNGKIKVVLISNGSLMHRPYVQAGLERLNELGGEVWFKLDRATAEGTYQINQTESTPAKVMRHLGLCAQRCPTWIQTCVFALDGASFEEHELDAYLAFLKQAMRAKLPLKGVLLYGLARASTQPEAPRLNRLPATYLTNLADRISETGLTAQVFP